MPDNLTIAVAADTSKLRADLAIAQQQVKQFGAELRAAAQAAAATGDRSGVDRLAASLEGARAQAAALNRELRASATSVTTAWAPMQKAVSALNDEMIALARSSLAFTAGLAGGLVSAIDLIGKTKNELLELRRLSQSTGFSAGSIKAINEALEDTGQEAGAGNKAMQKLAQAFAEVRQEFRNAGQDIGKLSRSVQVLQGDAKNLDEALSGVTVFRGGLVNKVEVKGARDALRALGVDMRKFKDDAAGNDAALQAVIDGFDKLQKAGKVDLANLAAMQLFGKGVREIIPALRQMASEAGGLQKAMDELRQQGRFPDEEAQQRALAYQKALKDVGDAVNSLGFSLLTTFGPGIQEQLKGVTNDINAITQAGADIAKLWQTYVGPTMTNAWAAFVADLQELWNSIDWSAMWSGFVSAALKALNTVLYAARAVAAQLRELTSPPVATAAIPPVARSNLSDLGFAGGGFIRGPGTGTSDSILARLSRGEFVVNAAATSRYLPLLRMINDGMRAPIMPRNSFATGGLVLADGGGSGTAVHLHLDGGSYELSGRQDVVESLMKAARSKQLLSAGRKPSWAGGRRYGG